MLWRRRRADGTVADPEATLDASVALRRVMPPDLVARHTELSAELVGLWRWEAARGLTLTDEMRWVVAGHAALPVTGLDEGVELYRPITSIILHRSTIVLRGPRPGPIPGSITEGPGYMAGQAHHRGPVLLSWSAVKQAASHPGRGQNVVLHEMAHRLDMLDGITDGTPPLGDAELTRTWARVFGAELAALRTGEPSPLLRAYAATNPAEFFAVSTEAFFGRPRELHDHHDALYELLRDFYRLDPAAWGTPP